MIGDSYYSWNKNTSGTWGLEEGTSSTDFWITFFTAQPTLDENIKVVKLMGQEAFSRANAARDSIETAMDNLILDGLPTPEMRFIGAVITKRNGDVVAMADGSVIYDLRKRNTGGGTGSNPAKQAQDIQTDVTDFDAILSSTDTDIQTALETLDDHNHDGTEIDLDTTNFDHNLNSNDDTVQKAFQHFNDHTAVGYHTPAGVGEYLIFETTSGVVISKTTTEVKTDLSLNNVENTAISTWTGSSNITTVGTIGTGTWQGTDIADSYIANAPKYKKQTISIACSDETTSLTTGTAKVTFRMPYAMTLSEVRASVATAPTGSTLVIDLNESGTTILSTKISIDASEKTSKTAATPPVISDSALADDAEITIDIDQIGSTVAGKGLKIILIGTI